MGNDYKLKKIEESEIGQRRLIQRQLDNRLRVLTVYNIYYYVTFGLHLTTQIRRTASFLTFFLPSPKPLYDTIWRLLLVRYDLVDYPLYDINLGATHTTILSTRGVQIPIDLVSSTTDSFWRCVVLFKPVRIPTSDPKSEFLCQSSLIAQNLQTPLKHLIRLGHLPRPRHHVSPISSQTKCAH